MRIISEFHDYYDSVQSQGQDQTVVWIRKPKQITIPDFPFPKLTRIWWRSSPKFTCSRIIVGFCGKIYPVLKLKMEEKETVICHTLADIDAFIKENFNTRELTLYNRRKGFHKYWNVKRTSFIKFFNECKQKQDTYQKWFIDNHSPVFVARHRLWLDTKKSSITFNAKLKGYEFYRIFDTFSTFQEIAMYYGGVLGGVREHVPDIDDKTLASAKGFDKFSFRKDPTKKRK